MTAHSSVLAWRILGTGEPGGLLSMAVAQCQTRLKRLSSSSSSIQANFLLFVIYIYITLAWKIPWMEEPGGL